MRCWHRPCVQKVSNYIISVISSDEKHIQEGSALGIWPYCNGTRPILGVSDGTWSSIDVERSRSRSGLPNTRALGEFGDSGSAGERGPSALSMATGARMPRIDW